MGDWIGNVVNGPGIGPYGMYPTRYIDPTTGISNWTDPVVPTLPECKYACGGSGFFDGDSPEKSTKWDGLMLYLGKLRDDGNQSFWRRILTADNVFMAWLGDPEVQNSLSKLLYEQINGPTPLGWDAPQILTQAEIDLTNGNTKNTGLVFLKRIFEKVGAGDVSFIKKLIFRSLSSVSNTEQCEKSEKQWNGNQTRCWLCNQHITNIYLGGAGVARQGETINPNPLLWDKLSVNPDGFKKQGLTVGQTAQAAQAAPASGTNPYLSSHSIHNKECEHVLPYIVGTFILQIYRGKPEKNVTPAQIKKIRDWLNFEYEWSHSYCNQVKSQGHFLQYVEETGQFEIDYVQVANFSKRLRCQGTYNGQYSKDEIECGALTGGGTLREENWRTFTDHSGDGRWADPSMTTPQKKFIITSCNPNASTTEDASCRVSFFTNSIFHNQGPGDPTSINNPNSKENLYLISKGPMRHVWMSDTDYILNKMKEIVDKLNAPIPRDEDGLPSASTYGGTALLRARISSFLITKYLEDIGKKLETVKGNQVWGVSLPSAWDLKKDKFKFSTSGKDTRNLAEKFVIGMACCCQAALKSGQVNPQTQTTPWNSSVINAQSWIDGCINGANAAYASIASIGEAKGEFAFGIANTRAHGNSVILMSNPTFVLQLLNKINAAIPDFISNITGTYLNSTGGVQEQPDIIDNVLSTNTPFRQAIDFYWPQLKSMLDNDWIGINMAEEANNIIPNITVAPTRQFGPNFNPPWVSVSRYISNNFYSFISNLYFYNSPISTPIFNNETMRGLWDLAYPGDDDWDPNFPEIPEILDARLGTEEERQKVAAALAAPPLATPRRSRRLQGLEPEFVGRFGKKSKRKPKSKPKGKPKRKAKNKKNSSDTALKNKLKMAGIKVTKNVKGKRVKLTIKELQKKLLAFKKLQAKARKLKISLKYKSTSGRYKFKSQKRLISDIKKATKNKRNTKQKNTKRKATKRKATKRKATKRKATKRKATKRKATKRKATKRK